MQIILHLKKHCIETAAKKRYEMLMQQYFSSHKISSKDEQEKMEIEMEHLLFFLENADFSYLRNKYPQLSGIEDISVVLEINRNEMDKYDQNVFENAITLQYYRKNAQTFFDDTIHIDMNAVYQVFLDYIPNKGLILDAGCGSGRDSLIFINKGYEVVAFDSSPELVLRASKHISQTVLLLSFEDIKFYNMFDGVWACASILHIPKVDMEAVLLKLANSLKTGGIIYTSYKYGDNEGIKDGRYFSDYTETSFDELLMAFSNLELIKYWYSSDFRVGRENEKWLNILLRKI